MGELQRPDVVAAGDLGIRRAVERAYGLAALPTEAEVRERAEAVAPAPDGRVPPAVALARQRARLTGGSARDVA